MVESDHMKDLDFIEQLANKVGLVNQRVEVRSLTVIKVLEPNGEWSVFNPITQGKDVAKMMFAAYKKTNNFKGTEIEFRTLLAKEFLGDSIIQA